MKLKRYELVLNDCDESIIVQTFVAINDEQAFEIAKTLYYAIHFDHWENVEELDGYVYTLDNLIFVGSEFSDLECELATDYIIRKVGK